jgi:hypothetical protein
MTPADPMLRLLARLGEEGVEYVLVGGQAVRLNGFLRATEDVDLLVRASRENGERIKRALGFLASSKDIEIAWFDAKDGEPENIRVADDVIVDLLFAANGETYDSVQDDVREIEVEGVRIRVLNIDGLLKTKTRTREKDILDRSMLEKIQRELGEER